MSQINYKIQIIKSLLLENNHVRGLAKLINTNQTTIARKLNELYEENIVDFIIRGKNKVFFLKKNLESKQYCCIMEQFKIIELVNKYPKFRRIIEHIRKDDKLHLAVLFGSYAKGLEKKDSDIDIYVNTRSSKIKDSLSLIDSRINVKIGLYDDKSLLIKEINKNHIILKGTEDYYEKFFS